MTKNNNPTTTIRISKEDSSYIKEKYITLQNFLDKKVKEDRDEDEKRRKMLKNLRGEIC